MNGTQGVHDGSVGVMWFRRDLRLADNPTLAAVLAISETVVPLFVLDDTLWRPAGDARRAFLVECLRALNEQLDGTLVVRRGRPERVVADAAQAVGARVVAAAEDFGPYGRVRDEQVARALGAVGAELLLVDTPYAVPPGRLTTRTGSRYRVFTPFARAWRAHGWPKPMAPPTSPRWFGPLEGDGIPDEGRVDATLPDAGEAAACRASSDVLSRAPRRLRGAGATSPAPTALHACRRT